MEFTAFQKQDITKRSQRNSTKKLNPEKTTKSKPVKRSPTLNHRKSRRRRGSADGDDFNVNFSKVEISKSNRILRSTTTKTNCSQDHCYCKASKCLANQMAHALVSSTDLAVSEVYDHNKNNFKSIEQEPAIQSNCHHNSKIEIIDFDDLNLGEDHSTKFDHNFNDLFMEDINLSILSDETLNVRGEELIFNGDHEDHSKSVVSDQNFCSSTDFEELINKYGNIDLDQKIDWMLDSLMNPVNLYENPNISNENSNSEPKVYLDLDQNSKIISPRVDSIGSPVDLTLTITSPVASTLETCKGVAIGPQLEATMTNPVVPKLENYSGASNCPLQNELPAYNTPASGINFPSGWTCSSDLLNCQRTYTQELEPQNRQPFLTTYEIPNNFSTSGGSIERILLPVAPRQPPTLTNYPSISVPFRQVASNVTKPKQFDMQNSHLPECRIHLVDTPPSFTRTSQPEATPIISKLQTESKKVVMTRGKPKRTRRTRAQMNAYREEIARNSNDRSKRKQRVSASREPIYQEEFLCGRRQTNYPETSRKQKFFQNNSVNETNLRNYSEMSQSCDQCSNLSNTSIAERRYFESLCHLNHGMPDFHSPISTESGWKMSSCETPSVGNIPSSSIWNHQLQSSYYNAQQVSVDKSGHLPAERQDNNLWYQPTYTPSEQLAGKVPDNFTNQMQHNNSTLNSNLFQ